MAEHANAPFNGSQNHTRVINSFLGSLEKRVLLWLSARTPAWVTPDTYTAIGVIAAVIIFLGYALTIYNKDFLWLANLGFVFHWFGDSMDGTLARFRKIERPRYGFFVDHFIDAVSVTLIFIGLGLSPYVRFDLALMTLVAYLLVSIFVYLSTYVNGVFKISYAGLGPTETRLIAVAANIIVFFSDNPSLRLFGYHITFYDIVAIVLCIIGFLIFSIGSIQMANSLSRADRVARREKRLREKAMRRQQKRSRQETRLKPNG